MHAIRLHAFGPPENLLYEEVDDPRPGPGQVRIAVSASGVHLIDTTLRRGQQMGPLPLPDLPAIPGREVAGRVDEVGDGVDGSWLGRRVVAHLGVASAGYAQLAVADVTSLHAVPDGMSCAVAVAMVGTGRTATGILDTARLTAADAVLVTAAAGGLGALLVQGALAAGAVVVGAAGGPEKVRLVRQLGATVAVDYTVPGWTDAAREGLGDRELTVALDGVAGDIGHAAMKLLAPGGRFLMFGFSAGAPIPITGQDIWGGSLTVGVAIGPSMLRRPDGIRALEERALGSAAAGTLVPRITRFALKDAAAAHAAMESRATTGKVVLEP